MDKSWRLTFSGHPVVSQLHNIGQSHICTQDRDAETLRVTFILKYRDRVIAR